MNGAFTSKDFNQSVGRIHWNHDQYVEDITIEFLFKSHTLTAAFVICSILVWFAFSFQSDAHVTVENIKVGVGVAIFFLLVLGLLVFPSGPFIRPHPLFWRFAFGIGVVYQLFLVILLFQSRADARKVLTLYDPTLNVPLIERQYASNCSLSWENLKPAIYDRYFVAHFVGWVLKSLMLRDIALCWVISVTWEMIEILFTHWLPNFAECWWDQWLLDVLICNGLGIYVGHKLCNFLEVRRYKWSGIRDLPTAWQKLKRVFLQFTPERWTLVRWDATSSLKRFVAMHLLVILFQLEELNAFFLKHILWIPPESSLNTTRLAIWALIAPSSIRQCYRYMTDPDCKRLGAQAFLTLVILVTELLIIIKFGKGIFTKPMPLNAKLILYVSLVIYFIFAGLVLRQILLRRKESEDKNKKKE